MEFETLVRIKVVANRRIKLDGRTRTGLRDMGFYTYVVVAEFPQLETSAVLAGPYATMEDAQLQFDFYRSKFGASL